jgi:hypothetical protein
MSRKSLFLLILVSFVFVACNRQTQAPAPSPTPTTTSQEEIDSVRSELEQLTGQRTTSPVLGTETQTPNREEAVLRPQGGVEATGYARQEYDNGQYKLTVLADLPEPDPGQTYQAWILEQSSSPLDQARKIGQLTASKSGYLLDYSGNQDFTNNKYFIISRETNNDNQIETQILNGQIE